MSADLDHEIDRAIRSLLDAEPPAGLRGRVLASIGHGRRPAFALRLAVPIAVVAMVVVLVLVFAPWRSTPPPATTTANARDVQLPQQLAGPIREAPRVAETASPAPPQHARAAGLPAAHAKTSAEPEDVGIEALARPAPLSVDTIAAPVPTAIPSIQPAPLRVAALELRALEMPPDAARGADR